MTDPGQVAGLAPEAIALAARLLQDSHEEMTRSERRQAAEMARLMDDPRGKSFTLALTDQVFRSQLAARQADQFRHILKEMGVPRFLTTTERLSMRAGAAASRMLPEIVMRAISEQLRSQSGRVILPGEDSRLMPHLERRREAGFHVTLNQLGEAILGEEEAQRRLDAILRRLATPGIDYVSVKISAICSRINVLAWETTLRILRERLRQLYRAAIANPAAGPQRRARFINLDMEEYRDLELTLAAFQQTLDEPEFEHLGAGIVLQAYLPDSHDAQRRLTEWAMARVQRGGAPIRLRIVKGANLAMEKVEAELHGWEQAPYGSKAEVDASYKRMVEYALRPEHTRAVTVGVASHNLFDVALAMLLAERRGVREALEIEMLEGMANHQARAVRNANDGMLLYAPVVRREDFHSAMGYLVRRLDENTADENFLRHLFGLQEGSAAWKEQAERFANACREMEQISTTPRRTQDRARDITGPAPATAGEFHNAPNTDWVLTRNRVWIDKIRQEWHDAGEKRVPMVIGGEEIGRSFEGVGSDPSRPGVVAYRYERATEPDIDRALACGVEAGARWDAAGVDERARILNRAAEVMEQQRGQTIACMIMDGGKAIPEADAEVSEAIDFARCYGRMAQQWHREPGVRAEALGVVAVVPPWNFPYAIPAGGVLAALAMGNAVILKPASETVMTAWMLASQLWEAGVPRDVLQLVACRGGDAGRRLITDPRTAAVVLTGAWSTAQMFLDWKPELYLCAETSGKNSMIITGAADRDLAIKDLVQSAFGHSGQKCSAASLAILEAEVYDDAHFLQQLRDAAASWVVGPSWDPASQVTPVIREPGDELKRGLTQLDEGESWLLEPKMIDGNPCCWSPGIRLGVRPGSWYHKTECFGPVLGLMRAENLEQAIAIQNSHELGLTAGLQSLDDREIAIWRQRVQAGNGYINRVITGAIVQRQPFGGWKKSCVGPGAKAGGPNYVAQFARWHDTASDPLPAAAASYEQAWRDHFSVEHDPTGLKCESNVFRYRALREVFLRLSADTPASQLQMAMLAARTTGTKLRVSVPAGGEALRDAATMGGVTALVEDAATAAAAMQGRNVEMLRTFGPGEEAVLRAANRTGVRRVHAAPSPAGRLELTRWVKEQSISQTMHRYGWTQREI